MTTARQSVLVKKKNRAGLKTQLEAQSMVWLAIVFLGIFAYIPMYGIKIAFFDYNIMTGIAGAPFVGFKYFEQFFTDPNLSNVIRNTFVLNILGLVIGFPAPIILALMITELRSTGFKRVAQTVSYLPHFLSWVIFGGLVLEIVSPTGIINAGLVSLGLIPKPINFIGQGKNFYAIFTIASIIKSVGFSSILFVAAITGIDTDMYEAAMIDGCTRFQRIWFITIPAIMGTIVIMFIFQISAILNTGIEQLLVLQNPLNMAYSQTLDTYTYKIGMEQMRFSYSTAVGLLKSIVSVVLLVGANAASNRLTGKGLF
ncbi:MAG: ABC transporter permease subunit [Clostridia bacterium]